jgi:hypothetical protein
MRPPTDRDTGVRRQAPTGEVGSEGGSPGDVDVARRRVPAAGTEATETWVPERDDAETIAHDETGKGRRSP